MKSDWQLVRAFAGDHPYEAGLALEKFPAGRIAELLGELPQATVVAVLERIGSSTGAACLAESPANRAAALVEALSLDAAARLLRVLAPDGRTRILAGVSERRRLPLERLLTYPPGTAGSLMDPQVLSLPDLLTVGEALARVQRSPQHALYYLYMTDGEQRLSGVINLRELMLALPGERLAAVMRGPVERLTAGTLLADILLHPAWHEFHALPVTGEDGKFFGAVRYRTLKRLEQEVERRRTEAKGTTALLSFGELCWVGFAGVLSGLAATVLSPGEGIRKKGELGHDRSD